MDLSKATTARDGKASTTTFAQEIAQSKLNIEAFKTPITMGKQSGHLIHSLATHLS